MIGVVVLVMAIHTADTLPARVPRAIPRQSPSATTDHWVAADKVKHFFMSALIQSTAYSVGRSVGAGRSNAQVAASVTSLTFGVAKEVRDRRRSRPFSLKDIVWDGAGALTAAALLNGTR